VNAVARANRLTLAVAFIGLLAAIAVGSASADFRVDDGPCPEPPGGGPVLQCPTAHVGLPYTLQIEAEDGCAPYNWFEILNGSLPAGLSMTRAGLISGTPTGTGLGDFWLGEHDLTKAEGGPDWCNFDDQSQKEFNIRVEPGLGVVTDSLKPGTVGQSYSQTLAAQQLETLTPPTGPDVQATWLVQSGTLPPGLTFSAQGELAGTPSAEGSWQFVLAAQNAEQTATKTYSLVVRQPVVVTSALAASRSFRAEVGVPLSTTARAAGGSGTYTWSLSSGALPYGLAFDATSAKISGTPRTAGRSSFALSATDSEGRVATVNASLTVAPKLAIKTLQLKPAKVRRTYAAKLLTVGGVQPVKWTLRSGKLPRGIRLVTTSGALVGSARRTGHFRVTLEARDALGARARKSFVLLVNV
jgi:putative Ig domain-containing protein